jgi:hypothetical protein
MFSIYFEGPKLTAAIMLIFFKKLANANDMEYVENLNQYYYKHYYLVRKICIKKRRIHKKREFN